MEIVTGAVERYLQDALPARPPVVAEMEERAAATGFPIIGPQVGRLLYLLASLAGARTVFELGSGYGYSAYWFGLAVGPSGRLILTDHSADNLRQARQNLQRAGIEAEVETRQGNALEILKQDTGQYDIILNDIDKESYPEVLAVAPQRLRPGGLLITDNVLWSGRVAQAVDPDDRATAAVLQYTREAMQRADLWTVLLPLRDGVAVSWKAG